MSGGNRFEGYLFVLLFGGLGCFLLSFVFMGLAPWTSLKQVTAQAISEQANPYYDENNELSSIGRGRQLYLKEACWHCHSQFVRPVAGEPFRYGPPSTAWETVYDVPHSFGTRRVGPDLSRESGRRSDDWHYAHLYNPRFVVPESVMPGYPWYFENEGAVIKPKQEAHDLVAYMQYLGLPFKKEIQEIVYPSTFKIIGAPIVTQAVIARGDELFAQNCVGCHGVSGDGNGPAKSFLQPAPASLTQRFISPSEVYMILYRGILGSAMPSYGEMPERDLWALSHYVSTLGESVKVDEISSLDFNAVDEGKIIYRSSCVVCHGENGDGEGVAAGNLHPRPKDFTRRIYSKDLIQAILKQGVTGTAMPPFPHLTDSQVYAISNYLTSRFHSER